MEPALTRTEAARLLNVSVATVDRCIADGVLPAIRLGRQVVRIPRQAIEALLAGDPR
jgi:excisionase family DNA binding protein